MRGAAAALPLLLLAGANAGANEDGARLFMPCRACHSLDPSLHGMSGPNLAGVVGRRIAGDPDFDYSPALREAREKGLSWDAQRLDAFLADPAAMFPGLWMAMRGIEDVEARRALLRFLGDPASR